MVPTVSHERAAHPLPTSPIKGEVPSECWATLGGIHPLLPTSPVKGEVPTERWTAPGGIHPRLRTFPLFNNQGAVTMQDLSAIREHMEVIGADGVVAIRA